MAFKFTSGIWAAAALVSSACGSSAVSGDRPEDASTPDATAHDSGVTQSDAEFTATPDGGTEGGTCVEGQCFPNGGGDASFDSPREATNGESTDAAKDSGPIGDATQAMCSGPNPEGCKVVGCASGFRCDTRDPRYNCGPSGCDCEMGMWGCTPDCNTAHGGVCVAEDGGS